MSDPNVLYDALQRAAADPSHASLYSGLGWILFMTIVGAAVATLFLKVFKEVRSGAAEAAQDNAASTLYQHLSEQIRASQERLDAVYQERNDLRDRVSKLEALAAQVEALKRQMMEKDEEIRRLIDAAAQERTQFMALIATKDARIEELTRAQAACKCGATGGHQ